MNAIVYSDSARSLLGVPNSLLAHFGAPPVHETLPELDRALIGRKKVAWILLDGLGSVHLRAHLPEIDAQIESHLANWKLDRLGTVERAVLRLGVWELQYTDVPPAVVINEAVDLVNWFSTPASRAFVNGVLDRIAHEKKEKGDVQ